MKENIGPQILFCYNALRQEYYAYLKDKNSLDPVEKNILETLKQILKIDYVPALEQPDQEGKNLEFDPTKPDDNLELDLKYQAVLNAKLLRLALLWLGNLQALPNFVLGFPKTMMVNLNWKNLCSNDPNVAKFLVLKTVADLCNGFAINNIQMQARALSLYKAADSLYEQKLKTNVVAYDKTASPLGKMVAKTHKEVKNSIKEVEARYPDIKITDAAYKDIKSVKDLPDQEHTDLHLKNAYTRPSL